MAKSAEDPHQFVSQISLVGRSGGSVKALAGFKKAHHTVPDAVNAATTAFLGKLCVSELTQEGEDYYQRTKAALAYKRTDLALEVTSPTAQLTTKDFVLEFMYSLEKDEPERYAIRRTLHSLRDPGLVRRPEFDDLFPGVFGGIVFGLTKGARVEAVIDAVEALDGESSLAVHYPSDCRQCVLTVERVGGEVIFDGGSLEMRFPKNGSPRELVAAFEKVRAAFVLSKNRVLAGLL